MARAATTDERATFCIFPPANECRLTERDQRLSALLSGADATVAGGSCPSLAKVLRRSYFIEARTHARGFSLASEVVGAPTASVGIGGVAGRRGCPADAGRHAA